MQHFRLAVVVAALALPAAAAATAFSSRPSGTILDFRSTIRRSMIRATAITDAKTPRTGAA
jgi:hypothetical protein